MLYTTVAFLSDYPTDVEHVLSQICGLLNGALEEFFPAESGVCVMAEPGRFFVASASTLVLNVIGKSLRLPCDDEEDEETGCEHCGKHSEERPHARTHAHTHLRTQTHRHMHTRTHTHRHMYTHAYTHTHIHTRAHKQALAHTCSHRRTHTRTHTLTWVNPVFLKNLTRTEANAITTESLLRATIEHSHTITKTAIPMQPAPLKTERRTSLNLCAPV